MKDESERRQAELRLETQYAITRALADSTTLAEAAPRLLEAVCRSLGWSLGALWRVDEETDTLRCVETWHVPGVEVPVFEETSRERAFARGEGLPGRVWESGQPAWITDVAANGNFPRAAIAKKAGLHAAFAFPILLAGETLGVLEFFSPEVREPDNALIQMMETVGSQIGQFIERKEAEEALRQSEDRFRTLAETASDAIITINEDSRVVFINRAAETIFGYPLEEMMGADLTMLMPEYLRRLHDEGVRRYIETGQRHINWEGYELPGLHKDGHEIPLEVSFSEYVKNGRRFFTGIVRDISERRRNEETQAERVRLAALTADIGVALTQSDTKRDMLQRCAEALVRHLDAAFARIWTLNEAEQVLELQASAGLYTHLDGAHSRVPVGKFKIGLIAEERKPHLTNSVVGDPRVGDQEWAKREGMVSFAGYPLIIDNSLVGVMAMFARHTLTEVVLDGMASVTNGVALGIKRKRAERELQESEARYRSLSEAMPQIVWATDAKGSHTYFNYRWYEYTGLSEEESMGFGFANALHPEDRSRTLDEWTRAWRDGEPYEIEYRFYSRPRDEYRWFLGRAVPVRDSQRRVVQWVGTCTDIEEQKKAEEALARLNEERAAMIEEVSTPIVPVWRGVLVLPIIGSLDTERMQRATEAALDEVTRKGARACIIDITGARIVDTHAVANLTNLVMALRLVGAQAIVTGIKAHAAQSLISLGVDFASLRTHRTLAEALASLINENESKRDGIIQNGTG
ncbi:MAG TPA: PAS domain S-box protein [Pyrinomonadaceae bacterium]|nr:PAS domain S-box protein [Pyrinomonadaceae bacterium]